MIQYYLPRAIVWRRSRGAGILAQARLLPSLRVRARKRTMWDGPPSRLPAGPYEPPSHFSGGFSERLMQHVEVRVAERSFRVLVSMLAAPTGAFEPHTTCCAYLTWRMNSFRDLRPLLRGGSALGSTKGGRCNGNLESPAHLKGCLARSPVRVSS